MKAKVTNRWVPLLGLAIVLSIAGCVPTPTVLPTATAVPTPTEAPQDGVLTMGSWRSDDIDQMLRILARFNELYPHISIKYDIAYQPDYDTPLLAQLQGRTGPDLFYLRSFAGSRLLFEQGYLELLDDLPGLKENFTPEIRAPWADR